MDILLLVVATGEMSGSGTVLYLVQFAVILLFSLSFHEAAHAWMANRCGDDTARLMGRMTLNPIAHIDPIGTLLVPGIMVMSQLGFFGSSTPAIIGWAKPVPVNPLRFRDYHKGEILVSLAGPFSNLILLLIGALACRAILIIKPSESIAIPLFMFFFYFAALNSILFIFNLIPIHPLDGSHVLKLFLSRSAAETYDRYISPYGFLILIIFINTSIFRWLYRTILSFVEWLMTAGVMG